MPLGPGYIQERDDDLYKKKKEEAEPILESLIEEIEEYEPKKEEKVREIVKKRVMPRIEEQKLEPLKRLTPQVIGSLFDRVNFLKQRINEINSSIKDREKLNDDVLTDIDVDIMEKEKMQAQATDTDERRNIKLDISILRREKRQERILFWRDILELKTELRKLLEQYETEIKILNIFKVVKNIGESVVQKEQF